MPIRRPTTHRMDRRSNYKNYELPGIYHITLKAAEALRSPFGKVVGKIDKPDGDPEAPSVALTPVGEMVEQELLHNISAHYPMVEVQDHIIMPEQVLPLRSKRFGKEMARRWQGVGKVLARRWQGVGIL